MSSRHGVSARVTQDRLVGREAELAIARRWLDDLFRGRPVVATITGEPGVGKSRFARELARHVRDAGGRVIATSCAQRGESPRSPTTDVIAALAGADPAGAGRDPGPERGGSVAADVDVIVPLVVGATAAQPLLVLVDDLHWADAHTLDVVGILAGVLSDLGAGRDLAACLVVTVRTPWPRQLDETVEGLSRVASSREMGLTGLGPLQLTELVVALTGSTPEPRLLAAIERTTGGNPLHVITLLRRLRRDRRVSESGGRLRLEGSDVLPTADPLAAELAAAVSGLSVEEAGLARTLAVMGDPCPVEQLGGGTAPAVRDRALEQLVASGLVVADGASASFAHPMVRNEVYRSVPVAERAELHARAAARIAERSDPGSRPGGDDAIAMAHHLHMAGDAADPGLTVAVARPAAEAAAQRGAWSDAARFWRLALGVATGVDRAELHLRAGRAAYMDLDATTCREHLRAAIDEARASDDLSIWGEALVQLLRNDLVYETGSIDGVWDTSGATDFLDRAGTSSPDLSARMYDILANIAFAQRRVDAVEALALRGLEVLGDDGDPATEGSLRFTLGLHRAGRLELDAADRLFTSAHRLLRDAPDMFQRGWVPGRLVLVDALRGRTASAQRHSQEASQVNRRAASWAEHSIVTAAEATLAVTGGRFAEAELLGLESSNAFRRSGFYVTPSVVFPALAAARALRGDLDGAREAIDELDRSGSRGGWRYRSLVDWLCGDRASVRASVSRRAPRPPGELSMLTLSAVAARVELALLMGRAADASPARSALEAAYETGVRSTLGWPSSVPRLLAGTCRLAGDLDAAQEWLERADRALATLESPVEEALLGAERGRWLLAADRRAEAVDQLERSVVDLDRLGMLPHRSEVIALLGSQGVGGIGAAPSPVTRVILFTDICSSTDLNRLAGDGRFLDLVAEHNRVMRRRLGEFDGVEVKQTGDGMFAWFSDPDRALGCAATVVSDIERLNALHPDLPVHLRAGLSLGRPLPMDGDLYGLSVTEAARICDAAEPGSVFAGIEVVDAASHPPPYRDTGPLRLKGLDPQRRVVRVLLD